MNDEMQHEMAMMVAMSRKRNSSEDKRVGYVASAKRAHKAAAR
jgi:hypothetical protein